MEIIRRHQYRTAPWKNGGGETSEIATSPDGATLENFDWRLSIASVIGAGPFSVFPGVDRTLSILEGRGIDLTVAGVPHRLTAGSAPLSFEGDAEADATPIAGAVINFNVMTRRARYTHHVERLDLEGTKALTEKCDIVAIFLHRGAASITCGGQTEDLFAFDTVIVRDAAIACDVTAKSKSTLYLVKFFGAEH